MGGDRWHSMALPTLYRELQTSEEGLDEKRVEGKRAQFGPNALVEAEKNPWHSLLFAQFKSLPIIMLIAAAAISFALGFTADDKKLIDAAAIVVAILLAVLFGFWQEYKAERALEALKKMMVNRSVVMRAGKEVSIDSREIVPGDIVILEEGARVPADMRISESVNLAVDQSMLTGESRPSSKGPGTLPAQTALSERRNMLFAGTIIVRGHCRGVAVATGMGTEFGKIVGRVSESKDKPTRLNENISDLAKMLGYAGITLSAVFFLIGTLRGSPAADMFLVAVTLAVAVIPEGLPTVLAITLAIGVQKMAKRHAIVRKMAAVETLGSATVICTDKTGTITQNRMAVQEILLPEKTYIIGQGGLDKSAISRDPSLLRAVEVMALCNNSMAVESEGEEKMSGDPTENALLLAVASCGASERRIRGLHKQVGEVPFDSERKMMSSIRIFGKSRLALVKGAPEMMFPLCKKALLRKGERPISGELRRRLSSDAHSLGAQGMRVLALAYRPIAKMGKYTPANTERGLVYVGLVAMEDPPRPEVPDAISLCRSAGMRVIMVTGDSLPTAKAIAGKVGLLSGGMQVVDGSEIEGMPDSTLRAILPGTAVFARVTPEQKYRVVSTLMSMGEVVAVTGDGVNDAPAIKKADIGVAMGITGTDVTKEVAEIVLTDDNFSSIVSAVKYGRTIFNNIKSFVRYQLSTNVAAISLMFAAPALSMPLPLLPLQILWINIIMDGPPAVALGAEPSSGDEMQKPPRNPKAGIMGKNIILSILVSGVVMAAISLSVFTFYLSFSAEKAFTVAFTLFVLLQLANALNCRSAERSAFSRPFSNPYLFAAIVVSFLLHMAIIYYAPLQEIFKTVPLGLDDFAIMLCAASLIVVMEEFKKKLLPQITSY